MPTNKHRLSGFSSQFFTYKQSSDESVEQIYTTLQHYQTEIASFDTLIKLADVHLVNSLLHALDSKTYAWRAIVWAGGTRASQGA